MYGIEDVIAKDFQNILFRNGFSTKKFKRAVENGSSYDPRQIVSVPVWVTIKRNSLKKQYGLYRLNWTNDFEVDLKNGYFNNQDHD